MSKVIRCLYGSQNFGYDFPSSDRDHFEIIYPTWNNILNNEMIAKERKEFDGSITKILDIRKFVQTMKKGNLQMFQVLYSKEQENFEDLKWFIDHRDEILRADLARSYESNCGMVVLFRRMPREKFRPTDLIRIVTVKRLLLNQLDIGNPIIFCDTKLRDMRYKFTNMSIDELLYLRDKYVAEIKSMESEFSKFSVNSQLYDEMDKELLRLLRANLI